jgi:phospholipid transport system substrate-binding protein
VLALALSAAAPAHAARNAEAEQYVQANATAALSTLANGSMSTTQRRQTFYQLMAQFADMPRIATFVLGRYSTQLRADATLRTEWQSVFQDYAIAVYEDRLQRFNGATLRVTGSTERIAGRDVIVQSQLVPPNGEQPTTVQWRLLRSGNAWKVVDVSLVLEGNQIWLAQQQQRDFLAALDRSSGDVRALIADVRQLTTSMRSRTSSRT